MNYIAQAKENLRRALQKELAWLREVKTEELLVDLEIEFPQLLLLTERPVSTNPRGSGCSKGSA